MSVCLGDLKIYIKRRNELFLNNRNDQEVLEMNQNLELCIRQISYALRHLHKTLRVIHRDLKPENILYNRRMMWKLSDFGGSLSIHRLRLKNQTTDKVNY